MIKNLLNNEMIEKQIQNDLISFQKKTKKKITYPIDLEFFAETLWNVGVDYEDDFSSLSLDENAIAFLSTDENQNNKIIINLAENQNEGRINFSIAHEIGHISLHSSIGDYSFSSQIENSHTCKNYSTYIKGTPEWLIEYQANFYASNLLLPKEELFKEIDDKKPLDLEKEAEKFMKKYEVSRFAFELRLFKLGFKTIHNKYKFKT